MVEWSLLGGSFPVPVGSIEKVRVVRVCKSSAGSCQRTTRQGLVDEGCPLTPFTPAQVRTSDKLGNFAVSVNLFLVFLLGNSSFGVHVCSNESGISYDSYFGFQGYTGASLYAEEVASLHRRICLG